MAAPDSERSSLDHQEASQPKVEALYGQYLPFVRGVLRQHSIASQDVDDLAQEVFIVLLRRFQRWEGAMPLRAWLFQVARRVAGNHRRGQQRHDRKHSAVAREADVAAVGPADPEQAAMADQAGERVLAIVRSLPPESLSLFCAVEIEGRGISETARLLGINVNTAYARLRRLRKNIDREVEHYLKEERPRSRTNLSLLPIGWGQAAVQRVRGWWTARPAWIMLACGLLGILAIVSQSIFGQGSTKPLNNKATTMALGEHLSPNEQRSKTRLSVETGSPHRRLKLALAEASRAPQGFGLTGGESYSGRVVDRQGRAVAEAVVCVDREHRVGDYMDLEKPRCTTSDRRGRFHLDGFENATHLVSASRPEYLPSTQFRDPGADLRLVLAEGGVPLAGEVHDLFGGPVAGAWVSRVNPETGEMQDLATTDEAGRFQLWVEGGVTPLAIGAEHYATAFLMSQAPIATQLVQLRSESRILGTVHTHAGEPAGAGIRVLARANTPTLLSATVNWGAETLTRSDGTFEIYGLQPGHYNLFAAGPGLAGMHVQGVELGVGERRTGIDFEVGPARGLHARVRVPSGSAGCSRGWVIVEDRSFRRYGLIEAGGVVEIDGLRVERVNAVVHCPGYPVASFQLDITKPQIHELRLTSGTPLTVEVSDGRGKSLAGVQVLLEKRVGDEQAHREQHVHSLQRWQTTDANGWVTWDGLAPGEYAIQLSSWTHLGSEPTVIQLGKRKRKLRLVARPGAELLGSVVDAGGHAVPGAVVLARALDGHRARGEAPRRIDTPHDLLKGVGQVMNDGSFRIAGLLPGRYRVWVLANGRELSVAGTPESGFAPASSNEKHALDVDVRDGLAKRIRLELGGERLSQEGRVVDDEGQGLADIAVTLRALATGPQAIAFSLQEYVVLSDAQGKFLLEGLSDGRTYEAQVFRPGGGVQSLRFVAGDNQSESLVLSMERSAALNGQLREPSGRAIRSSSIWVLDRQRRVVRSMLSSSPTGDWSVAGLTPGSYSVLASSGEYWGQTQLKLTTAAPELRVEMAMQPCIVVEGRLRTQGRSGELAGLLVFAEHREYGQVCGPYAQTFTDKHGRFKLRTAASGAEVRVLMGMQARVGGLGGQPEIVTIHETKPQARSRGRRRLGRIDLDALREAAR